eukprot:COSAG05_NODE_10932_length_538_cov_1.271071_1_plen_82_part_10
MKRRVSFADRCMRYMPSHGAPPGLPAACPATMRPSHPPPAAVGLRYTSGCASLLYQSSYNADARGMVRRRADLDPVVSHKP